MNLPIHLLEGFVRGYVDSDGCYTATEYKATSISKTLMYGIQQCVSKVYKMPVKLIFCKRPEHVTIEGRVCNQHDSYNMAWHTEKRVQDKAFYENGYVWFPIKEVVDIKQTATVYNMEVEDSHTYTANGAIVHNCTNISSAGKQAGFSAGSGTSSSLCWDCLKGIEIKRPKYLLMENVKALSHKRFMPDFIKIQMKLESFGYTNFWAILNSKDHGVPQNRERIFMVSIINEGDYQFPDSYKLTKRLRDIMEDNVPEEYYLNEKQIKRIIEHCDRKVSEGCGFKTNFVTPDDISGTIKTKEGQREYDTYIKIDNRLRRLTPRECFRLMGVGDTDIDTIQSTNISKSQQYKLAGNSIVVNVLYDIFKSLFIENKNTSTEKQLELF
jgi:DNA (cytosine-5)-methyltransferase 1